MPPRNRYSLFAAGWFILCWIGLLKESSGSPPPFPHFDKFAHFSLFFAQIWLLARSYIAANRPPPYAGLLIFALLFAISSEIAQATLTQTRSGDPIDALADLTGSLLAMWIAHYRYLNRNTTAPTPQPKD